jgi:hypothetical protein
VFFTLYPFAALVGFFFSPHAEFFPFTTWFLFSKVPPTSITRYDIAIRKTGEKTFDTPIVFASAHGLVDHPDRIENWYVFQRMGKAFERGDAEQVGQLRKLLEKSELRPMTVYEFRRIRYDPLDRWRTGRQEIEILWVGETGH